MQVINSVHQTAGSLLTLPKHYRLNTAFLSRKFTSFSFPCWDWYISSVLFVPLMDNDSAHHANIALHMHLTGDYVSLIDHAGDYLDKPHLHFWLVQLVIKFLVLLLLLINFLRFCFTILAVYSTYRLGKSLYNNEVGKLAALIIASAFAFMLANNDVRMDAILTACIAFSIWQLVAFIQHKKTIKCCWCSIRTSIGLFYKRTYCGFCSCCSCLVLYSYIRKTGNYFLTGNG